MVRGGLVCALLGILDGLVRTGGRPRSRGQEGFGEVRRAGLRNKVDLKGAGFTFSLVLLPVLLAENVQMDVFEPDTVTAFALEPCRGGGLVGDYEARDISCEGCR